MKLTRLVFKHDDWMKLDEAERLYAIRLAHVHNDLRLLWQFFSTASRGVQGGGKVEERILDHQVHLLSRIFAGFLYSAWRVINSGWWKSGPWMSKEQDLREARLVYCWLCSYFHEDNSVVRRIRDKAAFHYDEDQIRNNLSGLDSQAQHSVLWSEKRRNVFFLFAESVREAAVFGLTEESDREAVEKKIIGGEILEVWEHVDQFCNEVLLHTLRKCDLEELPWDSKNITDLAKREPVIFSDEDAIARYLSKKPPVGRVDG